jgi:hypothetical protein
MEQNWLKRIGFLIVLLSLLLNPFSAAPVHALSAPDPTAPEDGITTTVFNTPPLAIPEFKWAAVAGATKYRLQVDNDIAFTSPLVNITTVNTTYTPVVTTFTDGDWYWRVRVESPSPVSEYSSIWSFTRQWADPANAPILNTPADSATLSFYDESGFSWEPVVGAAKYKLQVYSSPGGWATIKYTATTVATTHQPETKLDNGIYYWRVVPVDAGNHDGTPSEERSFTASYDLVPTLLEPKDGSNPTFTPTFQWSAVRGAQAYILQYTTDPSFGSGVTTVTTRNTSHTPLDAMPNDVNYYWRVRVDAGTPLSPWTSVRSFIKKWYIQPVLLTPVNNYQHVRFPVFSWTPVPGVSYYKVEIDFEDPNFASPIYDSGTTANTFFTPTKYKGDYGTFYWRVTPYDGQNQAGLVSNTASYVSYGDSVAPQPVYPLYYYPPDSYAGFPGVTTNPHEDRTVPLPIFIWHRIYVGSSDINNAGQVYAQAYRLQVSTDPTFNTVTWDIDTENLTATPNSLDSFTPLSNTDYFWRVRPLVGGVETGQWSQIWKTHIDLSRGLTPTVGTAPTLTRPATGFEFAETTPLLEWFPLSGANSYDVQISRNEGFTDLADSATVQYPAYAPTESLAQRSLGSTDFGIYYWRVRKSPNGAWSETRRFQISAQSQWKYTRTLGDSANQLQIGSDPAGDVNASYDLTTLQATQDVNSWYFGFHVPAAQQNGTYALYLDLDHKDLSGADTDARGYTVATITAYRPEYAIYVVQSSGAFSAANVYLYHWSGSAWETVKVLGEYGGQINFAGNYVELKIPNTAIGYQDTAGSYAISLFSLPGGSGQPQDSVPSDPGVPGPGPISKFSNVTERMNLSMPPTSLGIDPLTNPVIYYPSILPFFWDWPVLAPWSGAIMKAYLDPLYTTEAETYTLTSDTAYYAMVSHSWGYDFAGDNTYYWRVRPRYRVGNTLYLGVWSQGWRFERKGFIPQNLQTSVTFATPTFSWDKAEGAESYTLQYSTDSALGTGVTSVTTNQNSYTADTTLANGTYYWRVRVNRDGSVNNTLSPIQSFTLALPTPTGLYHIPSGVVPAAPTLCWTPLVETILAAYKYRVQVSGDPTFSSVYDTVDTEQSCWTPIKGYADDQDYYWRVAVMDGQNRVGNYSDAETFTKQYPTTTLVSPASGSSSTETPTFIWTPVDGAAKYRLEISASPNFTPLYETAVTTTSTRWTPLKAYDLTGTYYWRVAIIDANNNQGPFVGATIILLDGIPVNVYIGPSANPVQTVSVKTGASRWVSYALNNGPVKITSTPNIIASQRVLYGGWSYSEMIGMPVEQLAKEYLFPYYNNVAMDSQLRVSNVGGVDTTITVYMGTTQIDSYPLAAGGAIRRNYSYNSGPLRVTSSASNILTTVRVLYGGSSYSELMGFPANQLTNDYMFPYYNNVAMDSQLRISNVGGANTTIKVYLGTTQIDSYTLAAGGATRKNYTGRNSGPLRVTSSVSNILTTVRVLYNSNSYSELMGFPTDKLEQDYWYPVYDNVGVDSQLRVSNVGSDVTTITVYAGGTQIDSYSLNAGAATRKNYPKNIGPLHVVSSSQPILTTIRLLYQSSSYYEMTGLPNSQLSTQYFFPWYNNTAMNSELRLALP